MPIEPFNSIPRPGASVTLLARDNSARLTGVTSAQGLLYLDAIPPGDYP